MRAQNQRLDPDRHSSEASEFEAALRERIIGQESVIRAVVDLYQVFCTGMCPQGRPVGNLLFLGPTGPGKTRVVEAAAEILFGGPRAVQQWLVGTHHGVSRGQLQVYLDEFVFRHNCRRQPMALFKLSLASELSIVPHRMIASERQKTFRSLLPRLALLIPTWAFLKQPDKQKLARSSSAWE